MVIRVYSGGTGGTVAYLRFVYRGGNVAYETDSLGHVNLRYTWGPAADDLLAIRDSLGNHYYVVQDKLHSVRGVVKRDGTWVGSLSYRADGRDGETGTDPGDWLRYRWTGREYDRETGFYFHRARLYDPEVGRFVQEDPLGYRGGPNLYAYASGDPLNRRDPWGTDDVTPECDGWVFENDQFQCRGGGGVTLPAVEVTGDAETDPFVQRAARRYVNWLMSTGQSWRIGTEAGLSREMVSRILGMGNPVDAYGIGVTLATPFGGGTITVGVYQIEHGGSGLFGTYGLQQGLDVSGSFSHSVSTNMDALGGDSEGGCASLFAEACRYTNAFGETVSGGGSLGVSVSDRFPFGGHAGTVTTVYTDPFDGIGGKCYAYGFGSYWYRC